MYNLLMFVIGVIIGILICYLLPLPFGFREKTLKEITIRFVPDIIKRYLKSGIGDVFRLPFGNHLIMNDINENHVYIEHLFSEPESTFIDALKEMSTIPNIHRKDRVKIICSKYKDPSDIITIEGRFGELHTIVAIMKKVKERNIVKSNGTH